MDLWQRLDEAAGRWNVLEHPFYTRWSNGDLRPSELSFYAGQYAHAVRALAGAARHAASLAPNATAAAELESHAAEEESHIGLWERFGESVDADQNATPLDETASCASAWHDPERAYLPTLVPLYAIESAQPAISETRRETAPSTSTSTPCATSTTRRAAVSSSRPSSTRRWTRTLSWPRLSACSRPIGACSTGWTAKASSK